MTPECSQRIHSRTLPRRPPPSSLPLQTPTCRHHAPSLLTTAARPPRGSICGGEGPGFPTHTVPSRLGKGAGGQWGSVADIWGYAKWSPVKMERSEEGLVKGKYVGWCVSKNCCSTSGVLVSPQSVFLRSLPLLHSSHPRCHGKTERNLATRPTFHGTLHLPRSTSSPHICTKCGVDHQLDTVRPREILCSISCTEHISLC